VGTNDTGVKGEKKKKGAGSVKKESWAEKYGWSGTKRPRVDFTKGWARGKKKT